MGNCHDSVYSVSTKAPDAKERMTGKSRHAGSILGIATIDDKIITCGDDKAIAVSKWASTKENSLQSAGISYLSGHSRAVNRVAIFHTVAGNPMCWTASRDLSIRCWDLNSNSSLRIVENSHSLNVSAIACGNHSDTVFSGSRDYTVKSWDTETGLRKAEFSCPRNIVTSLTIDHSAETSLFQGSEDLCVRVWDTKNNSKQPSMLINSFVYFPLSLDLHPDGNYLAAGTKGFDSVGCDVKIFDLRKSNHPVQELKGHTQDVVGTKYSKDGKSLISVSKDGSVICWSCSIKDENGGITEICDNSNFSKVASLTSTGKHFTDLSVLPYKCDRTNLIGDIAHEQDFNKEFKEINGNDARGKTEEIEIILSAFDGSLSHYCVKEKTNKKQITYNNNNKNNNNNNYNNINNKNNNCNNNNLMEFVLMGSTSGNLNLEEIEI